MKRNLYEAFPDKLPEEIITVLEQNDTVRIERIVSDGHASPEGFWYDQDEHEWVLLVSGRAVLSIETEGGVETVELCPGDHLLIPAHRRHRIVSTSAAGKTIWLAVFFRDGAGVLI